MCAAPSQFEFALMCAGALPAAVYAVAALPNCAALTPIHDQLSFYQRVRGSVFGGQGIFPSLKQQRNFAGEKGQMVCKRCVVQKNSRASG
mgnify:CR=1 FL=1